MTKTTEECFLQDIAARPGEITPRLDYADWLLERGTKASQARAKFLSGQCRLWDGFGSDWRSARSVEIDRINKFLRGNHHQWWPEMDRRALRERDRGTIFVSATGCTYYVDRGFPE